MAAFPGFTLNLKTTNSIIMKSGQGKQHNPADDVLKYNLDNWKIHRFGRDDQPQILKGDPVTIGASAVD